MTLRRGAVSSTVVTGMASAELFGVLGVAPAMGRGFLRGEDRPGAESVVVVSWGLWQQELGADPAVIGRRIIMGGQPTTIVGVMPPAFFFPTPEYRAWKPLNLDPASDQYQGNGWLVLVARVSPNVGEPAVAGDVQAIAAALGERFHYPVAWDKSRGASVRPLRQYLLGDVQPALLLLMGAVTLLLLMACANVAALVLARTTDRTAEMVLRTALGAGRSRLVRQITTESLVLSFAAAALGAGLATALFGVLVARLPLKDGFGTAVRIDWVTFASALGLAALAGMIVSLAPVRGLLAGRMAGVAGERGASGLRSGPAGTHWYLVIAEVALAVLLAAGAGLFIRSVNRLDAVDPGFDPRGVEAFDLIANPNEIDSAARRQFFREVVERVARIPGVQHVGLIGRLPIRDGGWQGPVEIEGRPDLTGPNAPNSLYRPVSAGYFATLSVRIVRGRGLEPADRQGAAPVAVVSESFARRAWPDIDPLGRRVRPRMGDTSWVTVVGIAEETRMVRMTGDNPMALFLPTDQIGSVPEGLELVVKTSGSLEGLVGSLRRTVAEIDSRVAVGRVTSMEEVVAGSLAEPLRLRFFLSLFAVLALALGTVGIYGVVSYSVARRRAEFGIRLALGAAPMRVLGEVVRQGMIPVVIGTIVGVMSAVALSRLVARFLFGIAGSDAVSLAGSGVTLLVVGTAAVVVPAWRAGRTSPAESLRAR